MAQRIRVLKPGDVISVRIPIDTKPEVMDIVNKARKEKKREFTSFVWSELANTLVNTATGKVNDTIEIPLPVSLSAREREQLSDPSIRALIGNLIYFAIHVNSGFQYAVPENVLQNANTVTVANGVEKEQPLAVAESLLRLANSMKD